MGFEYIRTKVISEFKAFYAFIYFKFNRVFIFIIILEVFDGKVVCQIINNNNKSNF